jgi:hypothetical protein
LKVLYVESFYPQLSESYVACEIKYLLSMGVEIEVWREKPSICPFQAQVQVYDGLLTDAIKASKPDLLHFHFLSELLRMEADVAASGLPVTLRGHSVDHSPEYLDRVLAKPWFKRLWIYPHFFAVYNRPKVEALPSCYDPSLYYPENKDEGTVVRACAGIRYKNLHEFLNIAALVEPLTFTLIFAHNTNFDHHLEEIREHNRNECGDRVRILVNLSHAEAAAIVRRSEISLYTHNAAAHPMGFPMSILESMASGGFPFIRNQNSMPEEFYENSLLYDTPEGAARALHSTANWDTPKWTMAQQASIKAVENLAAPQVIPKIYWGWNSILKGGTS